MTIQTPNGRREIESLFGRPALKDGTLDPAWEAAYIRLVKPLGWSLWYQDTKGPVPSRGIRLHTLVVDSFLGVMADIYRHAMDESPLGPVKWLHENRLDLHGGGFTFRAITGGKSLSLHAYGIAIDWDPLHNARGSRDWTLPDWWFEIWAAHGWSDGRHFLTPDPMHVQFATGA